MKTRCFEGQTLSRERPSNREGNPRAATVNGNRRKGPPRPCATPVEDGLMLDVYERGDRKHAYQHRGNSRYRDVVSSALFEKHRRPGASSPEEKLRTRGKARGNLEEKSRNRFPRDSEQVSNARVARHGRISRNEFVRSSSNLALSVPRVLARVGSILLKV